MNNHGVKALCVAVLHQTAKDLNKNQKVENYSSRVENDVLNGGIQLYMDLLNLKFTGEDFIKKARGFKPSKHIIKQAFNATWQISKIML